MLNGTYWWYGFGLVLLVILCWRLVLPLVRPASRVTATVPAVTGTGVLAPAPTAPPVPMSMRGWVKKNTWSILILVVGVVAVYWGFQNTQMRTGGCGELELGSLAPASLHLGLRYALIALNAKALGTAVASTLHFVLAGVMLLLFVVLPFIGWVNEDSPPPAPKAAMRSEEGCTKLNPCTPLRRADGSTEKVHMKGETSLCVDDSFFANLPRLGYVTSYQGTEKNPGCTTVSCKSDTFWFTPQAGVPVPKYWYVAEGSTKC